MNKLGIVIGATALVTLTGCLDPYYKTPAQRAAAANAATEVAPPAEETTPEEVKPVEAEPTEVIVEETTVTEVEPVVETTPEPTPEPAAEPTVEPTPEPETTDYIIQRGDYLAKISKKYNIKLDAIRKLNPQLKNDVVKLGQTIKLPGKIDVGAQTVPEGSIAQPPPRPEYKPYDGATKEYTVVAGDTLGKIAYGNGINIRQLKEMNGLSSNMIRVGQTLKIPANGAAPAAEPTPAQATEPAPAEETVEPVTTPVEGTPVVESTPADNATVTEPAPVGDSAEGPTYVVKEGDDILSLSIFFSLSPAEIRELNNLGETDELKPGQVLKLPVDTQI